MMKTRITIVTGIIGLALALAFLSCENLVGLGNRIDVNGPVVEFTEPAPRKAVTNEFELKGTVKDYTGVDRMVVKALFTKTEIIAGQPPVYTEEEYVKQWRYFKGAWEVSEDTGKTWNTLGTVTFSGGAEKSPEWNGNSRDAIWTIPIEMQTEAMKAKEQANPNDPEAFPDEGEYMFSVQAWDVGGMSDDNSFKTLVLIFDSKAPTVEIISPPLYSRQSDPAGDPPKFVGRDDEEALEFQTYHNYAHDSGEWKKATLLGKFITQEFDLRWQIDDNHDIWSFDLRLYEPNVDIDGVPGTVASDNYIYRYHENEIPVPATPDPTKNITPNGSIKIPNLAGAPDSGTINGNPWELKKTVGKTTVKVVAICYDAAGNANDERILGYFIFWPEADLPWIEYSEGLQDSYIRQGSTPTPDAEDIEEIYMLYPGRSLKANAFHTVGVHHVTYSVYGYDYNETADTGTGTKGAVKTGFDAVEIPNVPRFGNIYSQIFPWEFTPPSSSGYYLVEAVAYDENNTPSDTYSAFFRVQDITFPNFVDDPLPSASDPLFMEIGKNPETGELDPAFNNTITIRGTVSDATGIESLTMVWINPESKGYATMSQLAYFRDKDHDGWKDAKAITVLGNSAVESTKPLDPTHRNRLWKLKLNEDGDGDGSPDIDYETERFLYDYSQTINLNDLNIGLGVGQQPLKSQMFLLRAENLDGKCTIITYAPKGDEAYPILTIDRVEFSRAANPTQTFEPGVFGQIPKIQDNDTITVFGHWREDSAEYLNIETYLLPKLTVSINSQVITGGAANNVQHATNGTTKNLTPNTGLVAPSPAYNNLPGGEFSFRAVIGSGGNTLQTAVMKDVLVVSAKIEDIGGNPLEVGGAWLIESEALSFIRISSEAKDQTYNLTGVDGSGAIDIFLEFSKPVVLKSGRTGTPTLTLNPTGAIATYKPGQQSKESTRQYFTYAVGSGHNTDRLNVTGIQNTEAYNTAGYAFTFVHTPETGPKEEIRMTGTGVPNGTTGTNSDATQYTTRQLPVNPNNIVANPDYILTLYAGKNIGIDTSPPTVSSVSVTPTGRLPAGTDMYITVNFNKPVAANLSSNTTTPYLTLSTTQAPGTTYTTNREPENVRVSGNSITFLYQVVAGNNTNGNSLRIASYTGSITDLAGTAVAAITNTMGNNVYLDTVAPTMPIVRVRTGGTTTNLASTANTGTATVNAGNLYNTSLDLYFEASGAGNLQDRSRIEYSTNNGGSWTSASLGAAGATAGVTLSLSAVGSYNVLMRQYDGAGNVSPTSNLLTFTWDPGPIITRISSPNANGTYTNNTNRQDNIDIVLYFRKQVRFTAAPTLSANVNNGTGTALPNAAARYFYYNAAGARTAYSFAAGQRPLTDNLIYNYEVADTHNTNGKLNITGIAYTANTVQDSTAVDVTGFVENGLIPAENRLNSTKDIEILTRDLNATQTRFFRDTGLTGNADQNSPNFQGIRTDDSSYWTTLEITFNNPIQKGVGNITVTQSATNYRLPAVLNETQRNKFRNIPNFDALYTRGTNGYMRGADVAGDATSGANDYADTSGKYILNNTINTAAAPATVSIGGASVDVAAFATALRDLEKVTLSINSPSVEISGNILKVRLTGSNALAVPGANYTVEYPAGFVQDNLSKPCPVRNATGTIDLDGVAKPFIRVNKTQDTIGTPVTANLPTTPRLPATQPLTATVRMDSRTPGAIIRYNELHTATTTNNPGGNYGNWNATSSQDALNTGNPARPNQPTSATNANNWTNDNFTNGLTIGGTLNGETGGTATTQANVQGFQWRVNARAFTGAGNTAATQSPNSEEMAYRTVITYEIDQMSNNAPGTYMGDGDQIWIRGGEAIGSSTIPGFPLTWDVEEMDNAKALKKRAGIRLLSQVATNPTSLSQGTQWKFVSWEINVTTYFDMILGRDVLVGGNYTSEREALQYGPRTWTYQRAGWTSYKEWYKAFPGKHRWLRVTNGNVDNKGEVNFSTLFYTRSSLTQGTGNVTIP